MIFTGTSATMSTVFRFELRAIGLKKTLRAEVEPRVEELKRPMGQPLNLIARE